LEPILHAFLRHFSHCTWEVLHELQRDSRACDAVSGELTGVAALLLPRLSPFLSSWPLSGAPLLCMLDPSLEAQQSRAGDAISLAAATPLPRYAAAELEAVAQSAFEQDNAAAASVAAPPVTSRKDASSTGSGLKADNAAADAATANTRCPSWQLDAAALIDSGIVPLLWPNWFREQMHAAWESVSKAADVNATPRLSSEAQLVVQLYFEAALLRLLRECMCHRRAEDDDAASLLELRAQLLSLLPADLRSSIPSTPPVSSPTPQPAAVDASASGAAANPPDQFAVSDLAAAGAASNNSVGFSTAAGSGSGSALLPPLPPHYCLQRFPALFTGQLAAAAKQRRQWMDAQGPFGMLAGQQPQSASSFSSGPSMTSAVNDRAEESVTGKRQGFPPATAAPWLRVSSADPFSPSFCLSELCVPDWRGAGGRHRVRLKTQLDAQLLSQCASHARAKGLLDEQVGLQLDPRPLRVLLVVPDEERTPGLSTAAPLKGRGSYVHRPPRRVMSAAAAVAVQLMIECELRRLLDTAVELQSQMQSHVQDTQQSHMCDDRDSGGASALSSPASAFTVAAPAAVLPSLVSLRAAWAALYDAALPF
jgi:hypothetical protein